MRAAKAKDGGGHVGKSGGGLGEDQTPSGGARMSMRPPQVLAALITLKKLRVFVGQLKLMASSIP